MRMENFKNIENIDWDSFSEWLSRDHAKKNVAEILRNARKYYYVLYSPSKASEICILTRDTRREAMASLANLSKFLGIYDYWRYVAKNSGLKWESRSTLDTVVNILNTNIDGTKIWLEKALKVLPVEYGTILIFDALTGLRPTEAMVSCRLISELTEKNRLEDYLNREYLMLEHFKFKKLFLRKCKNAYISFMTPELLDLVTTVKPKTNYQAVDSALGRRGLPTRTKELRKFHATLLRESLPQELVDLIQGRVSQSVFLRFYYKPFLLNIRERVLKTIEPLQNELLAMLKD